MGVGIISGRVLRSQREERAEATTRHLRARCRVDKDSQSSLFGGRKRGAEGEEEEENNSIQFPDNSPAPIERKPQVAATQFSFAKWMDKPRARPPAAGRMIDDCDCANLLKLASLGSS